MTAAPSASSPPEPGARGAAPYRELTIESVVLGVVVGVALTISFTYAGLKLGFILPGSLVAAMVGWGVLRKGLGVGTIVENNINQTIAAAINVSSGGVIFTVPVLYLLESERTAATPAVAALARAAGTSPEAYVAAHPSLQTVDPRLLASMAVAAVAGSLLGVLFIIPSRTQMIELERLPFPTGLATASVLKASGAGPARFRWLVAGTIASSLFGLYTGLPDVLPSVPWRAPDAWNVGASLGLPASVAVVLAIAGGLTSLGGGYITGRAGLVLLVGGAIAHWIVTPLVVARAWMPEHVVRQLASGALRAAAAHGNTPEAIAHARDALAATWSFRNVARPLGVGMLLGGSLASAVASLPALRDAFASLGKRRARAAGQAESLDSRLVAAGVAAGFVALLAAGLLAAPRMDPLRLALAALVATAWMWLANVIVSITTGKTDNSPLSGMALITIVLIVLVLGREGALVALVMAVAVCVATSQGSDMMQDLKAGHLVGALPRTQQMAQLAVAWIGPLVSIVTLLVLSKRFVLGADPLTAPQGQAIKAALDLFAPATAPTDAQLAVAEAIRQRYVVGAITGLVLTLGAGGGLGVIVGLAMYLPMSVLLTYCLGCAIAWAVEAWKGRDFSENVGLPLAAGLLVGEGLSQVALVAWDLARTALGAT